jgi:hypothetical protein
MPRAMPIRYLLGFNAYTDTLPQVILPKYIEKSTSSFGQNGNLANKGNATICQILKQRQFLDIFLANRGFGKKKDEL